MKLVLVDNVSDHVRFCGRANLPIRLQDKLIRAKNIVFLDGLHHPTVLRLRLANFPHSRAYRPSISLPHEHLDFDLYDASFDDVHAVGGIAGLVDDGPLGEGF
jgi:hypothetical protein